MSASWWQSFHPLFELPRSFGENMSRSLGVQRYGCTLECPRVFWLRDLPLDYISPAYLALGCLDRIHFRVATLELTSRKGAGWGLGDKCTNQGSPTLGPSSSQVHHSFTN